MYLLACDIFYLRIFLGCDVEQENIKKRQFEIFANIGHVMKKPKSSFGKFLVGNFLKVVGNCMKHVENTKRGNFEIFANIGHVMKKPKSSFRNNLVS